MATTMRYARPARSRRPGRAPRRPTAIGVLPRRWSPGRSWGGWGVGRANRVARRRSCKSHAAYVSVDSGWHCCVEATIRPRPPRGATLALGRRDMCGIAGIVYRDRERPVAESLVRRMCGAIRHRGPDDEGVHVQGAAGLGMRRLSIIDL